MTDLAKLNFRIARLRVRMRGMQSDIRLLTNAGLDCTDACERLRLTQREMIKLIVKRGARG
ncbi:hypothetical protein RPMA_16355 [Tardiphaga alba]|uniref:Uncharacterized protein n=1 Tax=Tardiphaga alba TaxID=340268 RepID=A0ABX8A921_9BRAD|nr:hypothetical protein [Tardiphaga alba]QUS40231.1 hypothetical protein RPMA_16355 [Tardiphaga alba]